MDSSNLIFAPPAKISENAHVKTHEQYKKLYELSIREPESFWRPIAEQFYWKSKWNGPFMQCNLNPANGPVSIKFMQGGKTNLCYNCLDRNIDNGKGEKIAYYWAGNDPADQGHITFSELKKQVCKLANVLKAKGVQRGDRVAIYMPMIVELPMALLACARIGAIHSVVFGGFSAESLAERILDSECCVVITADGVWRGTKLIELKQITDEALAICATKNHKVKSVITVRHLGANTHQELGPNCRGESGAGDATATAANTNGHCSSNSSTEQHATTKTTREQQQQQHNPLLVGKRPYGVYTPWSPDVDCWWHEEVKHASDECDVEWMDAEDGSFILYTSGSTGKPKGVMHTIAGYMLFTATTFKYVFDYHDNDVYWCTADVGWITGHSYVVYGPLLNGATGVIFEGTPFHPNAGRLWQVVEQLKVTLFYTAPTAIRALMRYGNDWVDKYDRSSLRVLGTVGEPINPEAWLWYHKVVGNSGCAIVDTYWQTETGGHALTPLPGATHTKPGSACFPFFGIVPKILDESGVEIDEPNREGYLVFAQAWPGMLRTVYGDHKRFQSNYFAKFPGYYTTGDGARRDADGYYWVTGRIDDMVNVSGHLLSTAEIESALVGHAAVAEAAVVGTPHSIKGECTYAFVTLKDGHEFNGALVGELKHKVRDHIGAFAVPDFIQNAPGLPKTRSGKIMRRILRKIARGDVSDFGDTTTLADESVLKTLQDLRPPGVDKATHQ